MNTQSQPSHRHWFPSFWSSSLALLLLTPALIPAAQVDHVIHISVDGLRPDAVTVLGAMGLPNFFRLRAQGAFTDNARSDYNLTVTLPNHVCELTGRPVEGASGHHWTGNSDPPAGATLATANGSYVAGVFDVAHDHGLRTGLYASKTKFSLFETSWNLINGEPDATPPDNGPGKIDVYFYDGDTAGLVNALVADMSENPLGYAFLHLANPDGIGHAYGWDVTPGSEYLGAIQVVDGLLGRLFQLVDSDPQLKGRTAIILTADHGGEGSNHADPTLPADYTVPFYVWGPGVAAGADLYALNPTTRANPGADRPENAATIQPIRNGECANLALQLLGLSAVPGSTINSGQNLAWSSPSATADLRLVLAGTNLIAQFTLVADMLTDLQSNPSLTLEAWSNVVVNVSGPAGGLTNVALGPVAAPAQFYRLWRH